MTTCPLVLGPLATGRAVIAKTTPAKAGFRVLRSRPGRRRWRRPAGAAARARVAGHWHTSSSDSSTRQLYNVHNILVRSHTASSLLAACVLRRTMDELDDVDVSPAVAHLGTEADPRVDLAAAQAALWADEEAKIRALAAASGPGGASLLRRVEWAILARARGG